MDETRTEAPPEAGAAETVDASEATEATEAGAAAPQNAAEARIRPAMLITLALLAAVAPLGIDLYLPAFPIMVDELATTTTGVQLSLTGFLVGAGVGQLIFGPWSDRMGRYLPLLVGLALLVGASVVAVLAPSVEVLVAARLVQGIGGAAGQVIGRAMILDRHRGPAAARALSLMMMIGGVAPVVAPLVGSTLAAAIGWRGLLGIVAALAVVALLSTLIFLSETLPRRRRQQVAAERTAASADGAAPAWRGMLSRGFVGHVLAFSFAMAIMMSYISASPFVYQQMIGLSTVGYGIAFAVNAVGIMISSSLSARLAARVPVRRLAGTGLSISGTAVATILVLALTGAPTVWTMVPLFFAIAPLGLVYGNTTALALGAVPAEATGLASAVLGLMQFVLAGIVAGLVGLAGEDTIVPLAITMSVAAAISATGFLRARAR